MHRRGALVVVLGVMAFGLTAMVLPARPALACSCAPVGMDDMVEHVPDVAIAVVRRIDRDGGHAGVGLVEHTLRGSLPEQVPLALDDGASCKPWLAFGQLATLAFQPAGGSWRTVDCGTLQPAQPFESIYGAFHSDPDASAPATVLLAGPMPGAGLVALDAELDVLATSSEQTGASLLEACGEGVLTVEYRGEAVTAVRRTLPGLQVVVERPLGPDRSPHDVMDVDCSEDGRVTAVIRGEDSTAGLTLHTDLFADSGDPLPPAADAAIVGDTVLLLRRDDDAGSSELLAHDPTTGETTRRAVFDAMSTHGMTVAPGGAHLVMRAYADESVVVVVDTATGEALGRSTGWWVPTTQPWLDDQRLVLFDEGHGMGDPPAVAHRVVDLHLDDVDPAGRMPQLAGSRMVAGHGLMAAVGGAELAVVSPNGMVRASADPRTAAASDALLLGAVAAATEPSASPPLPEPDPAVASWSAEAGRQLKLLATVLLALLVLGMWTAHRRYGTPSAHRQIWSA